MSEETNPEPLVYEASDFHLAVPITGPSEHEVANALINAIRKLAEHSASIGDFLVSAPTNLWTHEVRTALNTIVRYPTELRLIAEYLDKHKPPKPRTPRRPRRPAKR